MENGIKYAKAAAEMLNRNFMEGDSSGYCLKLDVLGMVNKLGGVVYEQGYIGINGNSMIIKDDGSFEIYVSAMDSEDRQRFTIAHELGHYFIHYLQDASGTSKTQYYRTSYAQGGREEYEANIFAASLLMPEQNFKQRFELRGGDLSAVAKDFGVSIAAAGVRARSLGLIV